MFAHNMTLYLTHLKKSDSKQFAPWMNTSLGPHIAAEHADSNVLVIFMDGSAFLEPESRYNYHIGSAAGFRAYHLGRLIQAQSVFTSEAHSYHCELVPLSMAVGFTYLKSYRQVHLFSDVESTLKSVLNISNG